MKCFFIACLLLINFFAFSQGHTDAREYGINGKVKNIITYVYDSVTLENKQWIPVESAFVSRISYFFNESGNIDSMHRLVRLKEEGRDVLRRIIYQFINNKKAGYKEYDNHGLLETAGISWIDPFNYLTRVKYTDSDDATEIMNSLSSNYRDLRGEVRIFNSQGNVVYCSSYSNSLEGNIIINAVTTDCLEEKNREEHFIYQAPDSNNNPLVVITMDKKTSQPSMIRVRKIEYY
jgi:hypothetical protein